MNDTVIKAVLRRPKITLFLLALLTLIVCVGFKNLWLSTSFKVSFEPTDPLLVAMNEQEQTFSKNDNMAVLIVAKDGNIFSREALSAIDEITKRGWQVPFAQRVDSLTNFNHAQSDGDSISVSPVLEDPANKTDEELAFGEKAILGSPELKGYLISPKAGSATVLITVQLPDNPTGEIKQVSDFVQAEVAKISPRYPSLEFYVTGTVEAANSFVDAMLKDMALLLPIGYGLMILSLTLLLRSFWATIITLTIVTTTTLLVVGGKCWFDGAITAVTMFAPTMIMTIAIADCVHVLACFLLYYRSGLSKHDAMARSLNENARAVFLTSITTAVGFASLNFHQSPPYRELGNLVVAGVMVAWLLVYFLLPALVMLLPIKPGKPQLSANKFTTAWADLVIKNPKKILTITLVASVLVIGFGMPRNEFNEMFTTYLDDSFAFKRANNKLNQEMGGIHRLIYSVDSGSDGGVYSPGYLRHVDAFSAWLKTQPGVSNVYSYADVMKRLNRAMHGNSQVEYRLPDTRELAAQYALVHEMSLSAGQDIANVVSMDKQKTMVTVVVSETDSKTLLTLNQRAEEWLKVNTPPAMHANGVGLDLMFSTMAMNNIPTMVYGTFLCMAVVSLIILVAMRSWSLGALSFCVNALPVAMAIGLWGFINGRIDIGVAAVGTLAFGIVVDDTIHFMHNYKHYRNDGLSAEEAVRRVFTSSGLAMITTTTALVFGFGILSFSHYSANANMGFLTATCMILAILFDLFTLPAVLILKDRYSVIKHTKI